MKKMLALLLALLVALSSVTVTAWAEGGEGSGSEQWNAFPFDFYKDANAGTTKDNCVSKVAGKSVNYADLYEVEGSRVVYILTGPQIKSLEGATVTVTYNKISTDVVFSEGKGTYTLPDLSQVSGIAWFNLAFSYPDPIDGNAENRGTGTTQMAVICPSQGGDVGAPTNPSQGNGSGNNEPVGPGTDTWVPNAIGFYSNSSVTEVNSLSNGTTSYESLPVDNQGGRYVWILLADKNATASDVQVTFGSDSPFTLTLDNNGVGTFLLPSPENNSGPIQVYVSAIVNRSQCSDIMTVVYPGDSGGTGGTSGGNDDQGGGNQGDPGNTPLWWWRISLPFIPKMTTGSSGSATTCPTAT